MAHEDASIFLQKIYASMMPHFGLQALATAHLQTQPQTPQRIDSLVAAEMHRLKANYARDEERYVDQMMRDNPVIVERRNLTTSGSGSGSGTDDTAGVGRRRSQCEREEQEQHQQQRMRAESCRKSRINNKIKKAKTKFRHKFVASKLAQSAHMLECIRDVIGQAEAQLLVGGYTHVQLQRLRVNFGVGGGDSESVDVATGFVRLTPKRSD